MRPFSRAALLLCLALGASLAPLVPAAEPAGAIPAAPTPLLLRVQVATVATDDLAGFESRFTKWLGYQVRARGRVSLGCAARSRTPVRTS
jgi:hypothetical protein